MKRNLHAGKKPNGGLGFQVFTENELDQIHRATLEVLEHTGLFLDDEEALEVLDGGGAVIDKKNRVAKFPPNVVEDAIEDTVDEDTVEDAVGPAPPLQCSPRLAY